MSREHEVAAAAACQLTEQLALQQQQAAKQALKQVSPSTYQNHPSSVHHHRTLNFLLESLAQRRPPSLAV